MSPYLEFIRPLIANINLLRTVTARTVKPVLRSSTELTQNLVNVSLYIAYPCESNN
jgi:hypothetical protein